MGLQSYIDLTNLKPTATVNDIMELCEIADKNGYCSVCINPCMVKSAYEFLIGSPVKICTVIGFPLGANSSEIKLAEAKNAIADGADELDMVMNIGKFKQGDYKSVTDEINAIAALGVIVKVIIETCYLTSEEIAVSSRLVGASDAAFVKTSTGLGSIGATVANVKLMRQSIGLTKGVKAAGGIRNIDTALAMIAAGADRIGASSVFPEIIENTPCYREYVRSACMKLIKENTLLAHKELLAKPVNRVAKPK